MVLVWIGEQCEQTVSTRTEGTADSKAMAFQIDFPVHYDTF